METAATRVYSAIKEQIIEGRFAPGDRITEQNLATTFNTSRTPVREAMRQLVADGLVLFKAASGSIVRSWTPEEVRQIFELRAFVESEIASNAAAHITASELDTLRRLQDDIELHGAAIDAENKVRIGRLNREFHRVVAHASHNERLVAMLANAIEMPIAQQTFRLYTVDTLGRSFAHHRELIDALERSDAAWAKSVMSCHIHAAKHTSLTGRLATDD